jgi:hypothetical protein
MGAHDDGAMTNGDHSVADKKIETTIGALVEAEPALNRLAALRLDAKTRYHVLKLAKLVAAETKEHFYAPRLDAFKEFAVERPPTPAERARNGLDPVFDLEPATPENRAACSARLKDLAAVPVSIQWGPVTPTMLDGTPEFTAADMLALGPLFTLDEPSQGG